MSITITPETYEYVDYRHDEIQEIAEKAFRDAGLPEGFELSIDVVESSPLGRIKVESLDSNPPGRAAIRIEGGAFENLKAPRHFAAERAEETLGRLFFRLADALDPAFGFDGEFDSLLVPRMVAWDVYAVGRLAKLGYKVSHDRWLYLFRNRHGFTDDADRAFERLWSGEKLTWSEVRGLSEDLKSDDEVAAASARRPGGARRAG